MGLEEALGKDKVCVWKDGIFLSFGCVFKPECILMIYNYNSTQPRGEVFVMTRRFEFWASGPLKGKQGVLWAHFILLVELFLLEGTLHVSFSSVSLRVLRRALSVTGTSRNQSRGRSAGGVHGGR